MPLPTTKTQQNISKLSFPERSRQIIRDADRNIIETIITSYDKNAEVFITKFGKEIDVKLLSERITFQTMKEVRNKLKNQFFLNGVFRSE